MSPGRIRRCPKRIAGLHASLTLAVALALLLPSVSAEAASTSSESQPALEWYDLTDQTITAAGYPEPVTQSRGWAVSWLAAARAVGRSHGRSFATAALAQALHDTLAAEVPGQRSQLDVALASTLAAVPDGRAKRSGIEAGRREAAGVLAERDGDGLDTASLDIPWTPPPAGPGVWQPTPPTFGPAVRAGQPFARAFLLRRNDQFRPPPPPALDSRRYLTALAEVRAFGQDTSTARTPAQTEIARFWQAGATNVLYAPVLRQLIAQNARRSLAWDARLVAAFHAVTIDAQIAIYDAKFAYVFWRPVTAIRAGSVDQDPSWTPFLAAPRHPEYPGGHSGYAGAAEQVLTAFVGPRPARPVTVTSPTNPGVPFTFTAWSQITRDAIDARVWEGVHFRFSDTTGARVGATVADHDLRRLWKLGI
jgi:hypothetical protein